MRKERAGSAPLIAVLGREQIDRDLEVALDHVAAHGSRVEPVADLASFIRLRDAKGVDALVLDMGSDSGSAIPASVLAECRDTPVIVVVGREDADHGPAAVAAGADDFIGRDRLTGPALQHAISCARARVRNTGVASRANARLRALIRHASDVIAIVDRAARIRYVTPAVKRLLGVDPPQITGTGLLDRVHPDDATRVGRAFTRLISEPGGEGAGEIRLCHDDGVWRSVEYRARNALDTPAIEGVVLNLRDVTAERQLEEQFRQSQKMEAVGRLAGGVAHDFNNLLTAILGFTGLAMESLPPSHPAATELREVERNAERASALTRQLLAFSRRGPTRKEALDIGGVVAGMETMLRRLIEETIEIRVMVPAEPVHALADRTSLEQVLLNLAVNARDAIDGSGTIEIEVEARTVKEELDTSHSVLPAGEYAVLIVTDDGDGMTPDVAEHAFEPFYTTKAEGKGTGLGLSTVWGIVTRSGGHIHLYSEPGQGSVFRVYLPVTAPVPPPDPPRVEQPEPTTDATILLVEDEPAVRNLATRILARSGYRVYAAGSAAEAEKVAVEHAGPIDLLFTDLVMPGMAGPELASRMTRAGRVRTVLFTSGYPDDRSTPREGGNQLDFLEKPYGPAALLRAVETALGRLKP